MTNNIFNPANYVLTARQTWEKRVEFLAYIDANKHLALPFHVEGLQSQIPPSYPGEQTIILARSHHGKSTVMKDYVHKAQLAIEGRPGYAVGMVSHEDYAERIAGQLAGRYASEVEYQDDQFIYIGRSFGMRAEQVVDLHMTNIIISLEYGLSQFGDQLRYSAIFNDYAQRQPPDPFRSQMTKQEQKRLQIADDVLRWSNAAGQFTCPVFNASQALTKEQRSNYTQSMKIPGAADTEESKELYNYADVVYAYWQPKHDYPIGTKIEDGGWCFTVDAKHCFVRILKRKYCEELGYKDVVGRVFPLEMETNGNFIYSQEYHESIYTGR